MSAPAKITYTSATRRPGRVPPPVRRRRSRRSARAAGARHPFYIGGAAGGPRRRAAGGPLADRHPPRARPVRRAPPGATWIAPWRRRGAAQRGWARLPWRERLAILRARGRAHPRAEVRARRAHEPRGREEPARGDGRRRGVGRPDRLLLRPGRGRRRLRPADGPDHAGRAQHRRAPPLRRVRLHRAVQLSARALGRDVVGRAGGGQRGGLQAGGGHAAGPGSGCTRSTATRGCRRACSTSWSAGGTTIGDPLWQHPGVDGVVFTGSKAVGLRIHAGLERAAWIKPCLLELGGKNAAIVHAERGSRRRGRGRDALGVQPAEPEVQRDQPGVRPARRGRAVHRAPAGADPRRCGWAIPSERDVFFGPVINERRWSATSARWPRRGRRAIVLHGGDAAHGRRLRPRPLRGARRSRGCRSTARSSGTSCSCPSSRSARSAASTRRWRRPTRVEYGLTAGIFSGDPAEVERFFDEVEAGVCYANKRTGATTGAWPGAQPFCGWKGSGSTGKGGCGPVLRRAVHARAEPDGDREELE